MTQKLIRGTTWNIRGVIRDKTTGASIDLSEYTCMWCLKSKIDETETYIIDPIDGECGVGTMDVTVLPSTTKDVPPGIYFGEFEYRSGSGGGLILKKIQYKVQVEGRAIISDLSVPESPPIV